MCGLTGFWDMRANCAAEELRRRVTAMSDMLYHRGPDDSDVWVDAAAGLALGFRRLAILDLTPAGRQPMRSASGRYVAVFNGEIYNFKQIRDELLMEGKAPPFRGGSDTEVLLAGVEAWGLEATCRRAVGMFAIALWDQEERELSLVRDRLGVKPLYVGVLSTGAVLFGSELKALRAHPEFSPTIDRDVLSLFFRQNCVPGNYCIYEGVKKVTPGTILRFSSHTPSNGQETAYWDPLEVLPARHAEGFSGNEEAATCELERVLRLAVGQRMIADVPLGAFLSGGIDSTLVVALMQAQSTSPVRTFTIGYEEQAFNEAGFSRAIASHLGTDHTELTVSPQDALDVVPLLPEMYDEPFSDCSQIPTYLVSHMARRHVTVALAGDGGDEVFGGYNRHVWSPRIWGGTGWMPGGIRRRLADMLMAIGPRGWDKLMDGLRPLLPPRFKEPNVGYKLSKLAEVLEAPDADAFYRQVASHWQQNNPVLGGMPLPTVTTDEARRPPFQSFLTRMLYYDLLSYLPDDNLTKVDRASMANALEVRGPFLDHRVVEFAWRLPDAMKVRGGQGKWLLRHLLARYVPRALTDRPKMGFGVPIGAWLRGPLKEWAAELLDRTRLGQEGFLDADIVGNVWQEHIQHRRDREYFIWDVLMFEAWLEAQKRPPKPMAGWQQVVDEVRGSRSAEVKAGGAA